MKYHTHSHTDFMQGNTVCWRFTCCYLFALCACVPRFYPVHHV